MARKPNRGPNYRAALLPMIPAFASKADGGIGMLRAVPVAMRSPNRFRTVRSGRRIRLMAMASTRASTKRRMATRTPTALRAPTSVFISRDFRILPGVNNSGRYGDRMPQDYRKRLSGKIRYGFPVQIWRSAKAAIARLLSRPWGFRRTGAQ